MKQRDEMIERMATSLYDFINTEQRREIKISKDACHKLADKCLTYLDELYGQEIADVAAERDG